MALSANHLKYPIRLPLIRLCISIGAYVFVRCCCCCCWFVRLFYCGGSMSSMGLLYINVHMKDIFIAAAGAFTKGTLVPDRCLCIRLSAFLFVFLCVHPLHAIQYKCVGRRSTEQPSTQYSSYARLSLH